MPSDIFLGGVGLSEMKDAIGWKLSFSLEGRNVESIISAWPKLTGRSETS